MPCMAFDSCRLERTFRRTYDGPDVRDEEEPGGIYCEFIDVYDLDDGRWTWQERVGTGRRYELVPTSGSADPTIDGRLKEI